MHIHFHNLLYLLLPNLVIEIENRNILNKTINMQMKNYTKIKTNKTKKITNKITKKNTKRTNKYKSSNKIYYGGDMLKPIMVYYNNIKINNGDDLTNLYKSGQLNSKPTVVLNLNYENGKNKKYLIILHDPDAPNGFNGQQPNKNQEYIHWIFLQNNINNNNNKHITREILPYTPPSPPLGQHNYIFTVYDCSKFLFETYNELEKTYYIYLGENNNPNNSIKRNNQTGLIKLLEPFIVYTGTNTGKIDSNTKVELKFVVNSGK
jgi:phosphatidylethanolamine-binding protein (PEBP) family uncharacterized protein